MQRQQNHTSECVHVITDLAQFVKKTKRMARRKRERMKTSTSEIMYIKRLNKKKGLKSKLREFKRIFDVYQKRKAALRLGRQ